MIQTPGRNVVWSEALVTRAARRERWGHDGLVVWLTGLPSSGKSTLANLLDARLLERGVHSFVLDGDNVRHGLNRDLGFSPGDRHENIRRIAEVAKLFAEGGTVAITAFISPYRVDRDAARAMQPDGGFVEVFVDAPPEVCSARDPKGHWALAQAGKLPDFTGVTAPYESPLAAELHLDSRSRDPGRSGRPHHPLPGWNR